MQVLVRNIEKDFIVLSPQNEAHVEKADETLYQRIDLKYQGFKQHELVSSHEFDADWNTWEIHPHGDEIVLLLSGQITLILKLPDGLKSIMLTKAGSYIIVPKGIWHTAKTTVTSKLLFITPGEGTENKQEPE